jgi:carbon storage regulator CsrA
LKGIEMLILTRTEEQSVVVDGPCVVKVLEIRGNRIKLGFIGSRSTKVMRTEVIEAQEKEAATSE